MPDQIPQTVTLSYVAYEQVAAGYVGYYIKDGKVWAWVDEAGELTYSVDLI